MDDTAPTSRTRRRAATALAALAVIIALAGVVVAYADRVLFDADEFADHVSVTLEQEAVADEIAMAVADDVVLRAKRDLIAIQPVIQGIAREIVGSSAFRSLVRAAVADLHRSVFERDSNTVALTLVDVGTVIRSALEATNPKLAKQIFPGTASEIVDADPPDWLLGLVRTAESVQRVELALLGLALILVAGALGVGRDVRRTLMTVGTGAAIGAVVLLIALRVARGIASGQLGDPGLEEAFDAVWDTFLADLRTLLLIVAASGAVIAAATRSLLRPVGIEEPLRRTWRALTTAPERAWLRAIRAALLLLGGVVIVLNRAAVLDFAVLVAGLYVLYKGAEELLRMMASPAREAADARRGRAPAGRRALVAVAAASLIAIAVLGFAAGGGADAPSSRPDTCNGSRELCDRPLNEVAIVATHNAMSAADQPNYLFAQQDAPISRQLEDGVRGLLIDAHYGTRVEGGVKTDLSSIDSERETYAGSLGEEGLDAALRIRDQLGFAGDGERAVFLCHRFCELGALDAKKTLREVRDFVVLNPDAVVVIVVEDYVSPADWVEAVEASGLDEYVYEGPLSSDEMPTLGELVASGKRVVMMAENEAGVAPWYRSAYDELVQETPFSFPKDPALLADPDNWRASCKPNRGPRSAPFFLMNHWIDTSPAAKPSNAEPVNARDALHGRIRECVQRRGQPVNLLAVDFYATGDVFAVADELNRAP